MKTKSQNKAPHLKLRQRGAALIILMLIIVLSLVTLVTFRSERKGPELEAERKTALALAQAKEALLGYAASDSNRPGSLPCSDINDDGAVFGVDCAADDQVARLPWKRLGLPDIRDGSGERLWYAVSNDFRASEPSLLNSTNDGQITIRNAAGTILNNPDATPPTGVVAVIIAPGGALTRQDTALTQSRSCTGGGGCNPELICQTPYQSVAKCNPANYLDVKVGTEDNANYISYPPPPPALQVKGFIYGPIKDATGATTVNDRILIITRNDLNSVVTFRMARELSLTAYDGTMEATIQSIILKPTVWSANQWDAAVDTDASGIVGSVITLKFLNCAIIYTITGRGNVARSATSC